MHDDSMNLPFGTSKTIVCCFNKPYFLTGDEQVNEQLGLVSLHTV